MNNKWFLEKMSKRRLEVRLGIVNKNLKTPEMESSVMNLKGGFRPKITQHEKGLFYTVFIYITNIKL